MQAFSAAGQTMYEAQQAQQAQAGTAQQPGEGAEAETEPEEDVVEADYEIVEEEN